MRAFLSLLLLTASAAAQGPSDEQVRAMYAECDAHRVKPDWQTNDPKFRPPPNQDHKSWAQGWEDCSTVQDLFNERETKRGQDKAAQGAAKLKDFLQQLPK